MILLREKDKKSIVKIAEEILPKNARLIAYGSRVNGTAHDTSDLDLVIQTLDHQPLNINIWADFKEALQSSNIPILIDVFNWQNLPETFQNNINSQPTYLLWQGTSE